MQNSKLFLILHQLSTKEASLVQGLLNTPFYEARSHHLDIFTALRGGLKKKISSREDLNRIVFKKKISDSQLRLYMSELFKMVTQSLVLIHAKGDVHYQDKILIERFKDNENQKLFDSQFAQSKKRLLDYPYRNSDYYQLKYETEFIEYNEVSSKSRTRDLNLQELLDDVDHIFISKKLRQACLALAHQSVYGQEYNYGLLPDIIEYVKKNKLQDNPAIGLYYSGYQMLSHPKEAEFFNAFKSNIDTYKDLFPKKELQSLYIFAINQCIRLLNRGQIEYGNITLDLYEEALVNKYIYVDGYLSRFTYRNIAAIAVKIGEYDRAEVFTKENNGALKKEERESAFHFNNALISYYRKDFDTSLRSLQLVDFKDHLFNLAAKVIQLKVFYESDELDLLESHLDAMQMYLLRKKVIGYHKTNYRNIIKMTRRLLKTNKSDKNAINAIKNDLESMEILTERKWLINQLSK